MIFEHEHRCVERQCDRLGGGLGNEHRRGDKERNASVTMLDYLRSFLRAFIGLVRHGSYVK